MLLHILFFGVQYFAANAKNNTVDSQNLSAVSIGNDSDVFPVDSDIPEEGTVPTGQTFASPRLESLCCKLTLFCCCCSQQRYTGLFVLMTGMKGVCGCCLYEAVALVVNTSHF